MTQTHSFTRGTFSFFRPYHRVFIDRFGSSLLFCHLEFDTEAISDVRIS